MLKRLMIIGAMLLILWPTAAQDAMPAANMIEGCVNDYDESVDYFPDKVSVDYAQNFTVDYFNHYKVVTLVPWVGAEESVTYLLVQCGTPTPQDVQADAIVTLPVQRVVSLSTTFLPHIVEQGMLERLVGVDTLAFTQTEAVLERSEDIAEVGSGFAGFNLEVLLDIEPDVIFGQQFFAGDTSFDPLTEAGLQLILNSDFADTSPLAAAEWGKYLALYFNTEAAATQAFNDVETSYTDLAALVADVETRPTVIAGTPFQGDWFVAASDSTIAQLIADAGADYAFSDLEGTSVQISFEEVFDRAGDAAYWVNLNQTWLSIDEMLADDERYQQFAAFDNDNIWNNNLAQNAAGGNQYFELGFVNPHLILADLIAIFHPELLPDHSFTFYRQLSVEA